MESSPIAVTSANAAFVVIVDRAFIPATWMVEACYPFDWGGCYQKDQLPPKLQIWCCSAPSWVSVETDIRLERQGYLGGLIGVIYVPAYPNCRQAS